LTEPVSDALVLDVLAVAAWILWATFTLSVVVEVAAAVRGVPAPRVRLLGPTQALAGWLLAGMLAAVSRCPTTLVCRDRRTGGVARSPH